MGAQVTLLICRWCFLNSCTCEEKPWTSANDSKTLNYPLRPCCTCSLVRFPLGYCPSFNSLPLLSSTIFEVLPHPNEQHLCSSNHLHPSCIFSVLVRLLYIWPSFQPPFLELCFVRCLVSGLLDAVGLILSVDLELIASGWSFRLWSLPAFWLWA